MHLIIIIWYSKLLLWRTEITNATISTKYSILNDSFNA